MSDIHSCTGAYIKTVFAMERGSWKDHTKNGIVLIDHEACKAVDMLYCLY